MRAAIWDGPGEMHLDEVADATCPDDGCLLRVTACGICGTDVRTFFNGDRRIQPGAVLGHEICGEVIEVGGDAGGDLSATVGDQVHVISTLYCGHCSLCRGGNEHLCQHGGLMGFDYQGAYAELVAIPQVALKNVFVLPDGLDAVHATFADPLSDAICGHKDLEIGLEHRAVVIGAGPVGTAHVALALAQGADVVYLLETSAQRLDLARGVLGDANVRYVDTSGLDPVQFVRDETGDGADRVIVACSNVQAQEQAMEMAAPRGRVLYFGGLPKGTTTIAFPSNVLHYREVAVLGSYASRHRDQVQALEMLRRNTHNIRSVVSDVVSLDDTPAAFQRIRSGEALKVVVDPDQVVDLVCGIDVGSQGSCLSVFDASGERVATTYQPHPLHYPRPGWVEQDPRDWRAALVNGFRDLSARVNLKRVRAISFGSQLDGLVCVDSNSQPVGPAIIWMDRRADPLCREAERVVPADEWYRRSGCNLDGSHVAAKLAWVARERPDQHARTRRALLPGAYMVCVACGADAVDRSNASSTMLLDPDSGDWDARLLDAFGIDAGLLPPVVGAEQVVGTVAGDFSDSTGLSPGTLVVCGCGDEMAATLGAGLAEPGAVCDVLGTAEPVCAVADRPLRDPTRVAECHPHAAPGRWLLENPGWASGANYRWFRDELGGGDDYDALNAAAAAAPAGSQGLVFLPWMGGAMAPRWEADARGSWYGLTPAHGRGHLARALLEGSAYAFRDVVEAITAAGLGCERIVCVAGGARSSLVRQMRADVTGLPVTHSEDVETTSRGAAMLAAAGAGLHADVATAAAAMCRLSSSRHEPDPSAAAAYEQGYRRYRLLFDALAPSFAELAAD